MTNDSTHEARIVPGEAEALAQRFHETYERLAPSFGYETREASAKPWADVPDQNKRLMIAVCGEILTATPSAPPADLEAEDAPDAWAVEAMRQRACALFQSFMHGMLAKGIIDEEHHTLAIATFADTSKEAAESIARALSARQIAQPTQQE